MNETSFKPWKIVETREIFSDPAFLRLDVQKIELPDGRVINNYYRLTTKDYAIVLAKTVEGKLLVEKNYRHGLLKITFALPAGAVEPGENPLDAARRELLEETGYTSDRWQRLGSYVVSINHYYSTVHCFIANDAHKVAEPASHDLEEMELHLLEPDEIVAMVRRGDIAALSSVAAVGLAFNPLFADAEELA